MNEKLCGQLRRAAGYRNQSATPGVIPFPGIARLVKHPVYRTRTTRKSCYMRLPLAEGVSKVFTDATRMVIDNRGKPVLEMETHKPGTYPVAFREEETESGGTKTVPSAYNAHILVLPKEQLVPTSKPARLDPACPKARYRVLKRLWRKGLLKGLGAAIINAGTQGREVAA